jgi:hypothetical protein
LADILLAETLLEYVEVTAAIGAPAPLTKYPRLQRLYDHVLALPGVAAYVGSPKRFPLGDAEYAVGAATVGGTHGGNRWAWEVVPTSLCSWLLGQANVKTVLRRP